MGMIHWCFYIDFFVKLISYTSSAGEVHLFFHLVLQILIFTFVAFSFRNEYYSFYSESESEVTQSYPALCNPVDCTLPGSSLHGILQARILEWVAISFSRGSSQPMDQTQGLNLGLPHWRQMV